MQFVSLTRSILLDLQSKGYNILTTKNTVDDSNPTYYPITVPDVWSFLLRIDGDTRNMASQDLAILVIEEVLQNMEDGGLLGVVFIEDDHQLRLQQRLHLYNEYYQFVAHPDVYDFSFDPQRLLIRNYAVHTGDHHRYLEYLKKHYPEHVTAGMRDLEDLTRSLICLDTAQTKDWFMLHKVAVVETDIWFCDEDSILKVFAIHQLGDSWQLSENDEELIYNQVTPQDILPLRDLFWIDPRMG